MMLTALVVAFVAASVVPAASGAAEGLDRQLQLSGRKLVLTNLIGHAEVAQADGDQFEIGIRIRGADADPELVDVEVSEGSTARVEIIFPIDEYRDYVYPELGRSNTSFTSGNGGSWLNKIWGGSDHRKIEVRGSGEGLELWVDVTIAVPRRSEAVVEQRVGEIAAAGIEADLVLDTGSGTVMARELNGDVVIDTGSGAVQTKAIAGELSVDTGSGKVDVDGFTGEKIHVDTGSGRVTARTVECEILHIDTGSGSVEVSAARAERAKIDTGSGSVKLQLDRMGRGRFVLDTGSGAVDLTLPRDASAEVAADTGSGRIRIDIEGVEYKMRSDDEVEFTVGAGDARVIVDTGSGSITISQR
jgi:hypothetical protein